MVYDTTNDTAAIKVHRQGEGISGYEPGAAGFKMAHLKKLADKLYVTVSPLMTEKDIARDIARLHSDDAINAAHAALVASYNAKGGKRYAKKKPAIMVQRERERAEAAAIAIAEAEAHEQAEGDRDFGERDFGKWQGKVAEAETQSHEMTDAERKLKALQDVFGGGASVTRGEIEAMIAEAVAKIAKPKLIEVKPAKDLPPIKLGVQHKNFPQLLAMCNARNGRGERLNVWLHGEASSGKSAGASYAAKALGLPFYSVNALDQPYKLVGYKDANGQYHSTAFRKAVEFGGVFCFDEYDRSHPGVVIEMNNFLSTGEMWFPDCVDAPVKRHPDCVIIATGNTAAWAPLPSITPHKNRMRQHARVSCSSNGR
jgi:hypothetical protein